MSDDRTVTFKLNGNRPDQFTIERLPHYLRVLGDLVSSPGKVRARRITPGSVRVELAVEHDHYPTFAERLTSAKNPSRATSALRKSVSDLEEMITADKVTAEITAGRTKILILRGFASETGSNVGPGVSGHFVRSRVSCLGGKDAKKHDRIGEERTGREIRGEFRDLSLAEALTTHLWKGIVEVAGTARLLRHPDGNWELRSFRIDGVEELEDVSPSQVLRGLKNAVETVDLGSDPVAG